MLLTIDVIIDIGVILLLFFCLLRLNYKERFCGCGSQPEQFCGSSQRVGKSSRIINKIVRPSRSVCRNKMAYDLARIQDYYNDSYGYDNVNDYDNEGGCDSDDYANTMMRLWFR